jgi:glutamate synthase domain-containing protein 1
MMDVDERNVSGCGLTGMMNKKRLRVDGQAITASMRNMRERGNGLGAGFAAYGTYPDKKDLFALHLMYQDSDSKTKTDEFLKGHFKIDSDEPVPTKKTPNIVNSPIFWRYFVLPRDESPRGENVSEEDFILEKVMHINRCIDGAFVVSSGKDMAVFKGIGYPEDISEYFMLEDYKAHTWIGHSRFPTNTPGWWGGAHPFTILDWSIVHNGEISSYGINRRYLKMHGYDCTMQTDSEAIAYLFDLLIRKHRVPLKYVPDILASDFWKNIDLMDESEKKIKTALRVVYASALVNGPFAVIIGHSGGMMALSDRVKLRPMVAANDGDWLYVSSEEAGIREISPGVKDLWHPKAGELVVGILEGS